MTFFRVSHTKGKKYDAFHNNKWIPFGDSRYQHYYDSTGLYHWSHLDHLDNKRRINYRKRHSKILTKYNNPAYLDPDQPAYWSWNYLW